MKEKLKQLNIRITELAQYLNLSRPTLYKYIEEFDKCKYKDIDIKTKSVLRFIKKKTTVSKIQVINYIISFEDANESIEIKKLCEAILSNIPLKDNIIDDIHKQGVKEVVNRIEQLYLVKKGEE